jgi:hypothetical protein
MCKSAGSKKTAASWVKSRYRESWTGLINAAEQWHYGVELNLREQAIEFIRFVIDEVAKTELYNQIIDEINSLRISRA